MANQNKRIYIRVQVLNPLENEDEIMQDYQIDFTDQLTKEWLTRLTVYAMLNGKVLELSPIEGEENITRLYKPKLESNQYARAG